MNCVVGGAIKREINLHSDLESIDEESDCGFHLGKSGEMRNVVLNILMV